jgi:hypothetical protein
METNFIYVISDAEKSEIRTKIGISQNPEKRLKQLQTGNPIRLSIHYIEELPYEKTRVLESFLHSNLNHLRLKGEWFSMTVEDAIMEVRFMVMRWGEDPTLLAVAKHGLKKF